jgi:osmotically-inducible protein OsmY
VGYCDMDLNDQVRASLRRDTRFTGLRIDVNVRNGIVYLRGSVPCDVRQEALKLAKSVESVAAVVDEMSTG